MDSRAKHLHQKGVKSLGEVPRETLSLKMFVSARQSYSHLISVGDNATSDRRLTRNWRRSLPTKLLGACY